MDGQETQHIQEFIVLYFDVLQDQKLGVEDSFAQCHKIIDIIENPVSVPDGENTQIECLLYYGEMFYPRTYDVVNEIQKNAQFVQRSKVLEIKKYLELNNKVHLYYYFYLNYFKYNFKEDDVVQLRHFALINNRYHGKCLLGIDLTDNAESFDNYIRISTYLFMENLFLYNISASNWIQDSAHRTNEFADALFTQNDFYNRVFDVSNNKVRRLAIHGNHAIGRILPLMRIDKEMYRILSGQVDGDIFSIYTSSDYISIIQQTVFSHLASVSPLSFDFNDKVRGLIIRNICIDHLARKAIGLADLVGDVCRWIEDHCRHMTILALLLLGLFCADLYAKKRDKPSSTDLESLIQSTQDFADGILQLIENAIYHVDAKSGSAYGYLSIRIHRNNDENRYLNKTYPQYSVIYDEYLEVLISDFNFGENITRKFITNIDIRQKDEEQRIDIDTYYALRQKIRLEYFFRPDSEMKLLWNTYYNSASNITNHYGLQLFDSTVQSHEGYFKVISSDKYLPNEEEIFEGNYKPVIKEPRRETGEHLPGTQYAILLPLKEQIVQQSVGIQAELDCSDPAIKENWEINNCVLRTMLKWDNLELDDVEKKKKHIMLIKQCLLDIFKDKTILVINVWNIETMGQTERFAKALISYICEVSQPCDKCLRIAITGASDAFLVNFTRCFAIFYNKSGNCMAMRNTQVYLSNRLIDEAGREQLFTEIVFSGESLGSALSSSELLAYSKGEFNACLDILKIFLNTRAKVTKNTKIAPFDILLKDNGISLFERRVEIMLKNDIQKLSFGCRLNDIHTRIGSKIHVDDYFYEATLLFQSSYFTIRFAYLLAKMIEALYKPQKRENLVLVGYDAYSELLINTLKRVLLEDFRIKSQYVIYDSRKSKPAFRFWNSSVGQSDNKFVIIIPINSTLTTHSKVISELCRKLGLKDDELEGRIVANLAVILVRDSNDKTENGIVQNKDVFNNLSIIEKNYWIGYDEKRVVYSKISKPSQIFFNVCVSSHWQTPLACEKCFPKPGDLLKERPTIKLNKESVIPMILLGPKEGCVREPKAEKDNIVSPMGSIDFLGNPNVLLFGHFKQNVNHFEFFFKLDVLFQNVTDSIDESKKYKKWRDSVKKEINNQKKELGKTYAYIYDIVVVPINESNAAFAEDINSNIFQNASLIISVDVGKEYRDNIRAKYSNLTMLHDNIVAAKNNAVINIHFVDDGIVTGNTILRAKSLIHSLFPDKSFDNNASVKVNLFQNVILLFNRCSGSTKLNYINTKNQFFSYFDLRIPVIRNHRDNACAQCEVASGYERLQSHASTNGMSKHWYYKQKKQGVVDVAEIAYVDDYLINKLNLVHNYDLSKTYDELWINKLKQRYYRRMVCTDKMHKELDKLDFEKNNKEEVKNLLFSLIKLHIEKADNDAGPDIFAEEMEWIISYIKVCSRPYLVYRWSLLETIFSIMLFALDYIISTKEEKIERQMNHKGMSWLFNYIDLVQDMSIKSDVVKQECSALFQILISRLSSIGAKYIIRKDNIKRILDYAYCILPLNDQHKFEQRFASYIMNMLVLKEDAQTSYWLEYLLVTGNEYNEVSSNTKLIYGINTQFGQYLYLENTFLLLDSIENLAQKSTESKQDVRTVLQAYYFENLRLFIDLNLEKMTNEIDSSEKLINNGSNQVIEKMLQLYNHIMKSFHPSKKLISHTKTMEFYTTLLKLVQDIVGTSYSVMYGKGSTEPYEIVRVVPNNRKVDRCLKNDTVFSWGDTIHYRSDINVVIIKLIINGLDDYARGDADTVYFQLALEDAAEQNRTNIQDETNEHGISADILPKQILMSIRNILCFRNILVERLRIDFNNDLFESFKEEQLANKLLTTTKTGSHSPDAFLEDVYELLVETSNEDKEDLKLVEWKGKALQLAADSWISRLHIKRCLKEKEEREILPFLCLDLSQMIIFLNEISYQRDENNANKPTRASVILKLKDSLEYYHPPRCKFHVLFTIAALVQNATRHGLIEEGGGNAEDVSIGSSVRFENPIVHVTIDKWGDYLRVYNLAPQIKGYLGENESITRDALKYYFNNWYTPKVDFGFEIINDKRCYVVKLPYFNGSKKN